MVSALSHLPFPEYIIYYIARIALVRVRARGVTCICHDTGMCHYFGYLFWGCSFIFGYLFGLFPDFWVSFFGYSRIFGYHFLVKFDFFQNNPDFGVLILIFPSMTL